ncbi:DUF58 domain-containing protein [Actinomadura algeriensis]|uniref:Uncharacterized protein (DUF58 family) n=1 Tax=Actinomadura algeriensis TaxID=1679523 RepID=A0ABR9JRU9_9ACTN|nr:DUF58 domain-containing protein [Actinomadura algeriensis]MBE1532860.1 uncharacterized protein (DUF58 family) [Actinomadura algeriensis]
MAGIVPRLTGRGQGLLAAGTVLVGGGLGLGYPAPVALGALTVPAVALAMAVVGRPAAARVGRRVTPARIGAGATATVVLDVMASDRTGRTVAVERVTGPEGPAVLPLGPAHRRIRYELSAGRRGVVEAGPLDLARTDPLGLVRIVRRADDVPVRVLVHPRLHDLAAVPAAGSGGRDTAKGTIRATEGAFAGLREYAPGDDARRIHWRTSARRGRLMVREHADSARPGLTVLVDDRYGPDELDALAEAAASIVMSGRDVPVELRLAGGARSPATAGRTAHLDVLAEANARPGADFPAACARLRSAPSGRAIVLLPTSAPGADAAAAMRALGARRTVSLVGLIGPDGDAAADAAADAATAPPAGVRLLRARGPAEFAARWNESRWWAR